MALPVDSYPIATAQGQQIRLDLVRPEKLDVIAFGSITGTTPSTALLKTNGLYVFLADVDCIIAFTGVANKTPNNSSALLALAGERITCMLPPDAVSMSCVGLGLSGNMYIQTITNWAGLGFEEALSNG